MTNTDEHKSHASGYAARQSGETQDERRGRRAQNDQNVLMAATFSIYLFIYLLYCLLQLSQGNTVALSLCIRKCKQYHVYNTPHTSVGAGTVRNIKTDFSQPLEHSGGM